jgi:Na+/H+ antiporter NhaD/arsenite permease-like protein
MQSSAFTDAWVVLPFAGLLLSIAFIPGIAPRFWTRRMGVIAAGWSLALIPFLGISSWAHDASRALIASYLPFVSVLGGLYVTAAGILVRGGPGGRPWGNTAMLALGTVLASVMGTAGAAMVIIHPLLRANAHRHRRFHLVLFLILLVGNTAGVLTPIGNPPLLAGLLRGVPFLWPARNLLGVWMLSVGLLLAVFFALDTWLARSEALAPKTERITVRGWSNVGLVLLVGVSVMIPGWTVPIALLSALLSWWITPPAVHRANDFSWHPMSEVAILFVGIFITLEPVSDLLRQGLDGPFAPALRVMLDGAGQVRPVVCFWLVGTLSAFLDNAPAYLVFFDLAGIRPDAMTVGQVAALRAISAGAVMFGGLTYIGNAPNLMLRAVASHRGVRMPAFVPFMLAAVLVMLPVLIVVSLICFSGVSFSGIVISG